MSRAGKSRNLDADSTSWGPKLVGPDHADMGSDEVCSLETDGEISFDEFIRRSLERTHNQKPLVARQTSCFKMSRLLLVAFSWFCGVDLMAEISKDATIKQLQADRNLGHCIYARRPSARRPPTGCFANIWTRLLELFYVVCCIRAAVNVYYQYDYDRYLYQHRHLMGIAASSEYLTTDAIYINATIRLLEQKIETARAAVRSLGAPFMNMSYFVEIAYEYLACLSGLSFFMGRWVLRKSVYPLYCRFARIILDEPQERYSHLRLVHREVNRFIVSSRNFTRIATSGLDMLHMTSSNSSGDLKRKPPTYELGGGGNNRVSVIESLNNSMLSKRQRRLIVDQRFNVRQLKRMALNDSLRPLNLEAGWMNRLTIIHVVLSVVIAIYALLIFGGTVFFVIAITEIDFTLQPLDYYGAFEEAFLATCLIGAVVFYVTIAYVSCRDQIVYANKLRNLLESCLDQNQDTLDKINIQRELFPASFGVRQGTTAHRVGGPVSTYQTTPAPVPLPTLTTESKLAQSRPSLSIVQLSLVAPGIAQHAAQYDISQQEEYLESLLGLNRMESSFRKMNSNLLYCFMHYKIYSAQAQLERHCYGIFSLITIIIFLSLPFMARLHEPYVMEQAKYVQLVICIGTGAFLNTVLVPISYLNGRSYVLYRTMCRLLAHTISTTSQANSSVPQKTTGGQGKSRAYNNQFRLLSSSGFQQLEASNRSLVGPVYNLHLVWLLRKELSNPDMFVRQFSTNTWGVRLDYGNLIKIHFWAGIVLLSLVSGFASGPDAFFGGFLSDPFGVYQMDDIF